MITLLGILSHKAVAINNNIVTLLKNIQQQRLESAAVLLGRCSCTPCPVTVRDTGEERESGESELQRNLERLIDYHDRPCFISRHPTVETLTPPTLV